MSYCSSPSENETGEVENSESFFERISRELKEKTDSKFRRDWITRINELDEMIRDSDQFDISRDSYRDDGTLYIPADERTEDRLFDDNGDIYPQSNFTILQLEASMKPKLVNLVTDLNHTRLWVTLMLPPAQDGDNFGVEVQEQFLSLLNTYESWTLDILEQMYNYCFTRADIWKKAVKYTKIKDFQISIRKFDERHLNLIRLSAIQIRNIYLNLYDYVNKNKEKLMRPRKENSNHII